MRYYIHMYIIGDSICLLQSVSFAVLGKNNNIIKRKDFCFFIFIIFIFDTCIIKYLKINRSISKIPLHLYLSYKTSNIIFFGVQYFTTTLLFKGIINNYIETDYHI